MGSCGRMGFVRSGGFAPARHPGEHHPADIPTKSVNGELIDRHMGAMGLVFEAGRAQSAPQLDGCSWPGLPGAGAGPSRPTYHERGPATVGDQP